MERFCDTCGSLINAAAKICPFCGADQDVSAVSLAKDGFSANSNKMASGSAAAGSPDVNMQGMPYNYPPQNMQPAYNMQNMGNTPPHTATMDTGEWLGTLILTSALGVISLIITLYWAFGSKAAEPKKSFCRAMLLLQAAGFVLCVIFLILMVMLIEEGVII